MRTHHDMGVAKAAGPRKIAAAVPVLGLVMALSGCAVGPEFVRPEVPLNQEWSESDNPGLAARSAPDSAWWTAFNDPALDRLVGLAYRQNLPLQSAGLRIMESRAQLAVATGRKWPQIQAAFGSATAVGLSENAANNVAIDREFWDYQAGFDAVWELDFWGKFRQDERAETATYLATLADYDDALISLTAEVARTYALIRTFEVLIEHARRNAAVQEEGLQIAQSRFRHGATSELDVAQATTLLESTRATIPQLEAGLYQARNALSTLLGRPTGSIDSLLQAPAGIPAAPVEAGVVVPAEMLRRRPDVRSVELLAAAQCARIGVAKSELYPRLLLLGSIGAQASNASTAASANLFDPGSFFYSFGPRLIWPFFNYGRITNNVRVQDARLQQLLVDYENTVLRAAQEVEDGMTGYLKAREAAVFAENAAKGAERAVEISVVQYREGAVDYQRVLDAQRSLLQEQNTLARTQSSIATNLISLYKALGGGWELRRGQPVVTDSVQIEMQRRTNWGDFFSTPPPSPDANPSTPTDR